MRDFGAGFWPQAIARASHHRRPPRAGPELQSLFAERLFLEQDHRQKRHSERSGHREKNGGEGFERRTAEEIVAERTARRPDRRLRQDDRAKYRYQNRADQRTCEVHRAEPRAKMVRRHRVLQRHLRQRRGRPQPTPIKSKRISNFCGVMLSTDSASVITAPMQRVRKHSGKSL